jgi:hypothetical protein
MRLLALLCALLGRIQRLSSLTMGIRFGIALALEGLGIIFRQWPGSARRLDRAVFEETPG